MGHSSFDPVERPAWNMRRKLSAKRSVQFELLEPARTSILAWLEPRGGSLEDLASQAASIGPVT